MTINAASDIAVRTKPAIAQWRLAPFFRPASPNPIDNMIANGSGAIVAMRSQPGGLKGVKLVKPIIITLPVVASAKRNERTPCSNPFFFEVVISFVNM
jgi:hypothetical protein